MSSGDKSQTSEDDEEITPRGLQFQQDIQNGNGSQQISTCALGSFEDHQSQSHGFNNNQDKNKHKYTPKHKNKDKQLKQQRINNATQQQSSYLARFISKFNIFILAIIILLFSLLLIHALAQSSYIVNRSIKNTGNYPIQPNNKNKDNNQPQVISGQAQDKKQIQKVNKQNNKQILNDANQKPQISVKPIEQKITPIINNRYSNKKTLKDISNEQPYLSSPPLIRNSLNQMITRPLQRTTAPNQIFNPTERAYFAYRLYKNPNKKQYIDAEYYYYDKKYNISQYAQQLMLCIVAPGRNIVKQNKYQRFIDSIQRQNYTNYRLVYIDDNSDDNSPEELYKYIKATSGLLAKDLSSDLQHQGSFFVNEEKYRGDVDQRRLLIIKNSQRLYALANRNNGIRNYCNKGSIILDVDADDAIIGRQAFKFVNSIYQNQQTWMFNSVFIYDKSTYREVTTGPIDGVPIQLLNSNVYRTSMIWKTSQLRTFKRQLFTKINENDFKDEKGIFYQWASDVFIQMPLVQLAGAKHYKHLYEIVYFYDWNFDRTTVYKRRHYRDIVFMQTPYQPLVSLLDQPKKVQNYTIPLRIKQQYDKNVIEARKQARQNGRQIPF